MDREAEVLHLRELLGRVVAATLAVLAELEDLAKIRDDAERGAALAKLLERRIPELRIVTERNAGGSLPGRGSAVRPATKTRTD